MPPPHGPPPTHLHLARDILSIRHFLNQYPGIVSKVDVRLVKDLWTRVVNKDSHGRVAQHNHAFVKVGPQSTFTQYVRPFVRPSFLCVGWFRVAGRFVPAAPHMRVHQLEFKINSIENKRSVVAEKVGGSVKLAVSSGGCAPCVWS